LFSSFLFMCFVPHLLARCQLFTSKSMNMAVFSGAAIGLMIHTAVLASFHVFRKPCPSLFLSFLQFLPSSLIFFALICILLSSFFKICSSVS
jgi:hypothetical protein